MVKKEVKKINSIEAIESQKINMFFPKELVKEINELFQDVNIDINKVFFTLYYINKGKYNSLKKRYENFQPISNNYFKTYMSLNSKCSQMFKILLENKIIEETKTFNTLQEKKIKKYRMVNRWKYSEPINIQKSNDELYTLFASDYAFVQRYIEDGFIVKFPSKVEKLSKTKQVNELEETRAKLVLAEEKIKELENKLKNIEISINQEKVDELEEGEEAQQVYYELIQICKEARIDFNDIKVDFVSTLLDTLVEDNNKLKSEVISIFYRKNLNQ